MMSSQRRIACGATATTLVLIAWACGSEEVRPEAESPRTGPITLEAPPGRARSEIRSTAAETCLEMAIREEWSDALDPCTRAARDHPDDPSIQRALEEAQQALDEAIE
jgi:hypothetical protein